MEQVPVDVRIEGRSGDRLRGGIEVSRKGREAVVVAIHFWTGNRSSRNLSQLVIRTLRSGRRELARRRAAAMVWWSLPRFSSKGPLEMTVPVLQIIVTSGHISHETLVPMRLGCVR